MTNTSFRKKALLSSVAMLIVALIALSSATFAWFTSSTSATASGLSMSTTAQSGIMVKAESGTQEFAQTTTLNATNTAITLTPASYTGNCQVETSSGANDSVETPVFASTTSSDPDDFIGTGNNPELGTGAASYSEKVYVKSLGGSAPVYLKTVTITPATTTANNETTTNNLAIAQAVRVLVVDMDGKVVAHTGLGSAGNHLTTTSGNRNDTGALAAYTYVAPGHVDANKLYSNVGSGDTAYVTVYVYLDGEAAAVKSTGVSAQEVISSITIEFAL